MPERDWREGKWKETRGRWVRFDGNRPHGVEPCVGTRHSITLYNPAKVSELPERLRQELLKLGFPAGEPIGMLVGWKGQQEPGKEGGVTNHTLEPNDSSTMGGLLAGAAKGSGPPSPGWELYRPLGVEESAEVIRTCPERIVTSRFVDRYKPTERVGEQPLAKSRLTAHGFKDPDLDTLDTVSPTPHSFSITLALQICASRRWPVSVADLKAAFMQGERMQRERGPLYASQPPEGIPSLQKGQLVELHTEVYGLNSGPKNWRKTLKRALENLGYKGISVGSMCVFSSCCHRRKRQHRRTGGGRRGRPHRSRA